MPAGTFLDAFPSAIFIAAHVLFLVAGLWAVRQSGAGGSKAAWVFWLYAVSQVGFLAFFGGLITMKLAVLVEQTLMVVLVVMLAKPAR